MANLDDLGYESVSTMNTDDAIEMLRQIRLSRRIPVRKVTNKKPKPAPDVTAADAAELLRILEGIK